MSKEPKVIDGTVETDVAIYEPPEFEADIEPAFYQSDKLEEIEEGIRKVSTATDMLALVQGLAIVKIENDGLWRQGGYDTLQG